MGTEQQGNSCFSSDEVPMTYYLYSTKLVNQQGRTGRLAISVKAQNDWAAYANYPYIEVYCTRDKSALSNAIGYDCTEWLCRSRRTILFADTAGLVSRKFQSTDRELVERAKSIVRFDHISTWSSDYGKELLLTEPYCDWGSVEFAALHQIGIEAIRLPTNLSPYCGRWDPAPGAMPWTYSYLLCDIAASQSLKNLESRLAVAAPNAPRWNDTSGVRHV